MRNEKINRRGKGSGSRGAAPFIGLRVLTQDHQPVVWRWPSCPPHFFSLFFFFHFFPLCFLQPSVCVFTFSLSAYNIQPLPFHHPVYSASATDRMFLSYYFSSFWPLLCCLFLMLSVLQPWRYIYITLF
jgi:hypothetical protein